jgi:hypothetical protein
MNTPRESRKSGIPPGRAWRVSGSPTRHQLHLGHGGVLGVRPPLSQREGEGREVDGGGLPADLLRHGLPGPGRQSYSPAKTHLPPVTRAWRKMANISQPAASS